MFNSGKGISRSLIALAIISKSKPDGILEKFSLATSRNLLLIRFRTTALLSSLTPTRTAIREFGREFGRKRRVISGEENDLPRLKTVATSCFLRKRKSWESMI